MHESTRLHIDRVIAPQGSLAAADLALVVVTSLTVRRKPKPVATVISGMPPRQALPPTIASSPSIDPKCPRNLCGLGVVPVSDQEQ
jgi:hypothetical protein